MGATYTRQSSSGITDGAVIEASDLNNEFDQLLAAFAVSSGHTHDGTAAEGGPVTKLLGTAITIGDGTAGTDIAVTFDGETGDGVLTWMEDEDYFKFSDEVLMNSTEKLLFGDTGTYIHQSADGVLDLVSDTEIEINATTIDINGAVAMDGAITGATNITLSGELDAATLDISGNADIDGTLEADAITINSTAIGSIYGVVAGSSSIVTTGALDSGSITSGFGTIDTGSSTITTTGLISGGSLDIDNVLINGTTIGHTDDTDLMTLADGVLTVAGEVDATTLDISGNADIDGTLEADAITIDGVTLAETIADTVGAMVTSNTESGITVAYDDGDNTLDFTVGTLNQDTTGTAATVTTAAQTNITSLGTLTALTVDDIAINGKVVTMTGSASDTAVLTAGTNGTLSIVTTDAAAAAANIQITADGTVDIDSAGVLTLDSGAAINIEPASGSAILLDGTISVDAGVVTGATSITSTAFVGALTGNASGTAATVTTAAQSNITSLGTLTTLTVDNVIINGSTIGHTADIDLITVADGVATVAGEVSMTTLDIGGTNVTATAAELNYCDGVTSNIQTQLAALDPTPLAIALG